MLLSFIACGALSHDVLWTLRFFFGSGQVGNNAFAIHVCVLVAFTAGLRVPSCLSLFAILSNHGGGAARCGDCLGLILQR